MFERFTQSARSAVEDARFEAGRRGDRRIGTEHLLLAVLNDAGLAQAVGADAGAARTAADELDRRALAGIGFTLQGAAPARAATVPRHMPLTPGAKDTLKRTLTHATAEKSKTITSRHMLLALLDRPDPDPAAALLAALSVDAEQVRQRLAGAA